MLRRQNAAAIAATLLAAGALLPIQPRARFVLIGLAFAVICILMVLRLRAHSAVRTSARVDGVYARIERIRTDRANRRR